MNDTSDRWEDECVSCGHVRAEHRDDKVFGPERWCIGRAGRCQCVGFTDERTSDWHCIEHGGKHADQSECADVMEMDADDADDDASSLREQSYEKEAEAARLRKLAKETRTPPLTVQGRPIAISEIKSAWLA